MEPRMNREHKDRLFKRAFRDKKDLLQLYNAVNGTDYDNPDDLIINSLEDAIYMSMRNDVSFIIDDILNLYEHQSTFNPNMPLRGLFYITNIYKGNGAVAIMKKLNCTKDQIIEQLKEEYDLSEEEARKYCE